MGKEEGKEEEKEKEGQTDRKLVEQVKARHD